MHRKVNIIIYSIIILLLIYLIIINVIDHFKIKEYTHYMYYLDTDINIKIYSSKFDNKIFDEIENIYKEYDILTSNKENDIHNLYYINNTNEDIITPEPKLYELIKLGLNYYKESNGLININMGCIYNNTYTINEENKCDTDINKIELLDNKLKNNDFNINLDNIKVSYVNNIVSNYLKEKGYKNYIIDTNGNKIVGDNYYSKPFSIGIQYDKDTIIDIIYLSNKSMVTKGVYNNYKDIISPITLKPTYNYLSISVISDNNLLSNYLASILYFKSIEEGKKIALENNADVIWIDNNKEIHYTNGYLNYKER